MRLPAVATLASVAAVCLAVVPAAGAATYPSVSMWSGPELAMPSSCAQPNAQTVTCTNGWLAPAVPSFDLRDANGEAGTVDTKGTLDPADDVVTPLAVSGVSFDVGGHGSYATSATVAQGLGSSYFDPMASWNEFTAGAAAAVAPTLAPTVTVRARAQAGGVTSAAVSSLLQMPARRVYVTWDNGAQVDLHVWRDATPEAGPRSAEHAYYGAPWGVSSANIVSTNTQVGAVATSGLTAGAGPYALVDYPSSDAPWWALPTAESFRRQDGYTVGLCQYAGSGATVTVTLTELDGTARTFTKTLANERDAWLVGTTGRVAPVVQSGWCNGNEPAVAGAVTGPRVVTETKVETKTVTVDRPVPAAPVVPKGKLAKKKVKHGKSLRATFTGLPKGAVVTVRWQRKGARATTRYLLVGNGRSANLVAPGKKGAYTLTVSYTSRTLARGKVTVTK